MSAWLPDAGLAIATRRAPARRMPRALARPDEDAGTLAAAAPSGVRTIKEIADQLSGRAGARARRGARRGLEHALGCRRVAPCVALVGAPR